MVEGLKIENLLSQYFLSKVINEPTHISQNFDSCIDLLFRNQENLITDSGIQPSLDSNCHHQTIYGKFNSNMCKLGGRTKNGGRAKNDKTKNSLSSFQN